MDLLAATATTTGDAVKGWLIVIAGGLIWLGVYAFACWRWPWTTCTKCEGKGKFTSPSGKNFRKCPKCKGSPTRMRTGRRIFNWFSVMSKEVK